MRKEQKQIRAPYAITHPVEQLRIGRVCGVSAEDVAVLDALARKTGKPYYTYNSEVIGPRVYCAEYYTGFTDPKINGWKVTCFHSREVFIEQMEAMVDRLCEVDATVLLSWKGEMNRVEPRN
jgi:hypothetical protein